MWPFKSKNKHTSESSARCTNCGSRNTEAASPRRPDKLKVWRGQRYLTCRCFDCGKDFLVEEQAAVIQEKTVPGEEFIDNPDELEMAEEEIKREIEESGDHRCR